MATIEDLRREFWIAELGLPPAASGWSNADLEYEWLKQQLEP